jgi:hypothetical protein
MGKYLGLSRNIGPTPAKPYYGLENYNETGNPIGFQRYSSSANPQGIWLRYAAATSQNTALGDDSYRAALKLRICQLYNDSTVFSIETLLQAFWPGRQVVLFDSHNMTIEYFVSTAIPLPLNVWQAYLPSPTGVGISSVSFFTP